MISESVKINFYVEYIYNNLKRMFLTYAYLNNACKLYLFMQVR